MSTETTLITGASSGIGLHLAHEFAKHGHPVVITAPVESELREIAQTLQSEYGVQARFIAKNLEEPNAAQELFDELKMRNLEIEILVNNAGHGFHGKWWELPIERDLSMIRLNIEAVMRLTKLFLPPMLSRGAGKILNTASVASFGPGPMLATYFATKAFVLSWSEALATELKETAITVTALCPGVTDTDFFEKGDAQNMKGRQSDNVQAPQEVAAAGYEGLMKKKLFVVSGVMNKAMVASRSIIPDGLWARLNEGMNTDVPPEQQTHQRGEKEDAEAKKA